MTPAEVLARHVDEPPCVVCGDPRDPCAWNVPDDLWLSVVGKSDGVLCIRCFNRAADDAGIQTSWIGTRFDLGDPSTWHIADQMNLATAKARVGYLESRIREWWEAEKVTRDDPLDSNAWGNTFLARANLRAALLEPEPPRQVASNHPNEQEDK